MGSNREPIDALVRAILDLNPLQRSFLQASLRDLRAPEADFLSTYLRHCRQAGVGIQELAATYDVIVKDTLREQMFFQRHRRYRHASFAEVAGSVYLNADYMRAYMHGLALTLFLWPNHRALHRFFLDRLPREASGSFLEIGPGHGVTLVTARMQTAYRVFEAVDLSPTSVEMTRDLAASGVFGRFDNLTVTCGDFLDLRLEHGPYDAVVMGEVLEHVEEPQRFLERIRDVCQSSAFVFVTTAINAAAVDHIFLFETWAALEDMVARSGLRLRERLLVPYVGLSLEEAEEQRMPINAALVLTP